MTDSGREDLGAVGDRLEALLDQIHSTVDLRSWELVEEASDIAGRWRAAAVSRPSPPASSRSTRSLTAGWLAEK